MRLPSSAYSPPPNRKNTSLLRNSQLAAD